MQNIFSIFFATYLLHVFLFVILETSLSCWPLFLHSVKSQERSEVQSHTHAYTNMRTHADACKHLLCVHNAAKYSLGFFQPSHKPPSRLHALSMRCKSSLRYLCSLKKVATCYS